MKYYLPLIAAALCTLSACNNNDQPEVVGGPADPMAAQLANAGEIELPPAVKESHQYRCKDNSLIFVDFMSDDKTLNLRTDRDSAPIKLTAAEPGEPFTAEGGYEVTGAGKQITANVAGKGALSCRA